MANRVNLDQMLHSAAYNLGRSTLLAKAYLSQYLVITVLWHSDLSLHWLQKSYCRYCLSLAQILKFNALHAG